MARLSGSSSTTRIVAGLVDMTFILVSRTSSERAASSQPALRRHGRSRHSCRWGG
jgi:hypothetical protein